MASNQQNVFKSFAWHVAMIVLVVVFGKVGDPSGWAYAIAAPFFLVGITWSVVLYKNIDESTIAPYFASTIGAAIFGIFALG